MTSPSTNYSAAGNLTYPFFPRIIDRADYVAGAVILMFVLDRLGRQMECRPLPSFMGDSEGFTVLLLWDLSCDFFWAPEMQAETQNHWYLYVFVDGVFRVFRTYKSLRRKLVAVSLGYGALWLYLLHPWMMALLIVTVHGTFLEDTGSVWFLSITASGLLGACATGSYGCRGSRAAGSLKDGNSIFALLVMLWFLVIQGPFWDYVWECFWRLLEPRQRIRYRC